LSELKEFDDTISDEDEYETPQELYEKLCQKYQINPLLDAAANANNTKCQFFLGDALHTQWTLGDKYPEIVDVWCNPPHSRTEEFVKRADNQWQKYNINIIMIIPANTMSSNFWHECIEGITEYHAIKGRPTFLKNGKPTKFNSRNAYVCVIWRKRK